MFSLKKLPSGIIIFSLLIIYLFKFSLHAGEVPIPPSPGNMEKNKAALNVIHSLKLKTIMGRLNMLAYEREYTELELNQLRAEQIELLIQAANELAQSVENLPDITAGPELSEADRITFRAMAGQLYRETRNLQNAYDAGHLEELEPLYQRLHETCNACHRLFRDW